jgi:Arc/MetJ family transcription regulator
VSNLYVEVDDEALNEAAEILGTRTKKDTVNAALLEVAKRRRRLKALEELAAMGERGDFDLLLDKENYRR